MNEEKGTKQLLAVYGTLKQGYGNNVLLRNSKFVGTHVTEPEYTMYSAGGFPICVDKGDTPIACEIFEVTDRTTLERIDSLEGFIGPKGSERNWYDKKTITTPYGDADMYVMHTPFENRTVVENGTW